MTRGADFVVQALAEAGVKVIFTLSGNQIMPVFDACIDAGIRLIHVRHEAAAVYMAEGYAQVTGEIGVALVTAAPGFANAMAPLFTAQLSESPVLLLSGDSPIAKDGAGAFQELDQVSISTTLTKLSRRLIDPATVGSEISSAIHCALSDRPGPVHLALPFDVLQSGIDKQTVAKPQLPDTSAVEIDPVSLARIVETLATAKRPLILTGPMLSESRTGNLQTRLENALDTPVVTLESPRGLNDPALGDFTSALASADVILSLGKNINFTVGFGSAPAISEQCQCLLVDSDEIMLKRAQQALGPRVSLSLLADIKSAAHALVDLGDGGDTHQSWRNEFSNMRSMRSEQIDQALHSKGPTMNAAVVSAAIQRFVDAADEPILVIDGGEAGQWVQACTNAPTRVINGPAGAIGGCLCYAIAAKIARPTASVLVFMGDGTAGFHFSEFETAHRYGVNIIAVIGHDARWNAEYMIQLRDYGASRLYECELDPTRYDLAAAGFGCHGEYVTRAQNIDTQLESAANSALPACVVTEIEGLAAPTI